MEEQVEIVTFDSDMATVSEGLPYETSIPLLPSIQHTDDSTHSVVSFLRRPQLLSTFRWQSSAARSSNLFTPGGRADGLLVPTGLFSNRTMVARKLDGFTSFKATCVLKLQINSQPFQCGRLLMAAAPMPGLLGNRRQFIFSHVSNAQNLNHVQMDIAKDTEVELRIPFISPYNCFDLIDGKFDWAEVRILVYSPLNMVGGGCLQCLVYGHFEDIEMGAPTSGGIRQQSRMPSVGAIDKTKSAEATGRFTGALAQLGTSLVNRGLSMARPITSIGDGIASAMGWSKPILAKPSRVFLNRPTEGFNYMDGIDQSLVLGMTASNQIEPIPGLVGTNVDETAFNTLKRIPQMITAFSYSDNILTCSSDNREPVMLWQCSVSPSMNIPACYYVMPTVDTSVPDIRDPYGFRWKQPTTLNYITSPFLYWTGSLVYTFKFIKTDYHSGRVEISFHPFVNTVDTTRMDYVYRTVIDLRKNSEVSVTIPYIAAQPWKRISTFLDPINPDPPAPGRLKDVTTGMLYVRALTPLICANSIIANSIEVVVEARAGDDFEVAGPVTSKFLPFSFQNPQNPTQQSGSAALRVRSYELQMNELGTTIAGRTTSLSGLAAYDLICIDFFFDKASSVNVWTDFTIHYSWDGYNQRFCHNGASTGGNSWLTAEVRGRDVLNISVTQASAASANVRYNFDWFIYPYMRNVPTNIVSIDPSQLPLMTKLVGETIVHLDQSQIPLPIASEGGGTVKIDPTQIPLKTEITNIPLPTTGGGSGPGGTVTINPDQLPLWTSDYNLAPLNPRQQAGQLAMAGVTETRTRAIEGWLPPSITGSSQDGHRPSTTHLCIGEKFQSFRQYAKRFAFCMIHGLSSEQMFSIQPVELIRPGALYLRPTTESTGNNERTQLTLYAPNTNSELSGSPLAFVAGMYAFYRGSTRFKAWIDPRQNPPNIMSGHLEYTRQIVDSNIINDNIENFMTPIAYETPNTKQLPEFQVPYYSPTIVSSTWSHGIDNQFDTPLANLVLSIPDFRGSTTIYPLKIAVAAGDDMDFHQFIGPPPVMAVGDILIEDRFLHYPPTGFSPTQKIALNPNVANRRTELPASSFNPVPYSALRVQNNITGNSCPPVPQTSRITFVNDIPMKEGKSLMPDVTLDSKGIPIDLERSKKIRRKPRQLSSDEESDGHDTVDTKQPGSRSKRSIASPKLSDYEFE